MTETQEIEVHIRRNNGRRKLAIYAMTPVGGTFPAYPRFTKEAVEWAEDMARSNGARIVLDEGVTLAELGVTEEWPESFVDQQRNRLVAAYLREWEARGKPRTYTFEAFCGEQSSA